MTSPDEAGVEPDRGSGAGLQAGGVLLFLFIPVVLWLFVGHPRPIVASLVAGVALMLAHRFVARPYMERVRERKCLWCNRVFAPRDPAPEPVELDLAGGPVTARACPGHGAPLQRFLAWTWRLRTPLRAGIFLPLLALLGTLGLAAAGAAAPVEPVTAIFKVVIGVTVNVAAVGAWIGRPASPARVAFPAHNFFLLGVRALLWIFRVVGIWWIVAGLTTLLAAA